MNRFNLIENGYFAKELPPCFTTKRFAQEFDAIMHDVETKQSGCLRNLLSTVTQQADLSASQKKEEKNRITADFRNKLSYSSCVSYNIPKAGLSRKEIRIPNPLHQGKLVKFIENTFPEIVKIYDQSVISLTRPIQNDAQDQPRRAFTHSSFSEFREKCVLSSYHMHIQLKTDISKFYPSIYTHAIPWAIDGKQAYKKNWALSDNNPRKKKNLFGDEIDAHLRNCQSKQTKGIPIGPDTSLIIAELIGCHIDSLFQAMLKKKQIDFVGFRYMDDYYLYFNNQLEAEIALDILEKILADFELAINHEKTFIQTAPFAIETEWALGLKSFFFRPTAEEQRDDIWNYFALAFQYAKKSPDESVLAFALSKFFYVRIERDNWDIFESLLLKTGLAETSTIQSIAKILISYKSFVSKRKIKNFAYELIKQHAQKNHDYEIAWALWLVKQFEIAVRKEIFEMVFRTNSVAGILIGLELLQQKNNRVDTKPVLEKIDEENLTTQYWLLVYEAAMKGWLGISAKILDNNFFFSTLKEKSISFYDEKANLKPIKVQRSLLNKILSKIAQIEKSLKEIKVEDKQIRKYTKVISELKKIDKEKIDRDEFQNRLSKSEQAISALLKQLTTVQAKQDSFDRRRAYFILENKLGELQELTMKELAITSKEGDDLLFDPTYG
jgi:hypothetical protein